MKINAINKEDIQEPKGYTNYTGVGTMKVLALNPTDAQCQTIKGNEKAKAKSFVKKDIYNDGVKWTRVHFIVETVPEFNNNTESKIFDLEFDISDRFLVKEKRDSDEKVYFFITDNMLDHQIRVGKDKNEAFGKIQEHPNMSWYLNQANVRQAKEGERELTMFMAALANYGATQFREDGISFDDFDKLYNGDFSEMKELLTNNPVMKEGMFKALAYLEADSSNEFKYSKVFNKYFTNFKAGNYLFERYLNESDYNKPRGYNEDHSMSKCYYNPSLEWEEFDSTSLSVKTPEEVNAPQITDTTANTQSAW